MPCNISGKYTLPDTTGAVPGYVQFILENTGGNQPQVSGAAISPKQTFTFNADGTWSGTIYRNDEISVNGAFSTWWHVTYFVSGLQVGNAQDYYISAASATIGGTGGLTPITTFPAPAPPSQPLVGAASKLFSFPLAASTWTGVHSMGTQAVQAIFYDSSWNEILPDTAVSTDVNTFTATFLEPQAGFMVVVNVGNWTPSVANPNNIIGNPTSSQSIIGDFPFTIGGSVTAKRSQGVRFADQFAGADVGAQIMAAIADLPNFPGCTVSGNNCKSGVVSLIGFSGTTQTQSTTVTITSPYVQVIGPGSPNLQINCTMNADCWNVRSNPFSITIGNRIGGFQLVGTGSANASAVGIHTGDLIGAEFFDIQIDNFLGTNSACFWVDNQLGWFERNTMSRLETGIHGPGGTQSGCKKDIRFTVNGGNASFGYNRWFVNMSPNTIGWSLEVGNLYNNFIQGNANVGTTSTLFSVTGGLHSDNALAFQAECTPCVSPTATGFNITGGASFSYSGTISYTNGNILDAVAPVVQLPGADGPNYATQVLWSANAGGTTICNGRKGLSAKACLQNDQGAPNNFQMGLTTNGYFDGSNWHFDADGVNNGGNLILGSNSAGWRFYAIPTNTPASAQNISQANIDNFKVGSVDQSATWTFRLGAAGSGAVFTGFFGSLTANAAQGGSLRLAAIDAVCWRNQANSGDVCLQHTGDDTFSGDFIMKSVAFASLGTPSNGTIRYCSDCTLASPCAGGGTGALAKRINGAWVCN